MKKRLFFSPFKVVDWIDNHKSETVRRVSHGVLAGLLLAGILTLLGLIFAQRATIEMWLSSNSKSVVTFLKLPIQLQVWIVLLVILIAIAATWIFRSARKDKLPDFVDEIRKLRTQISKQSAQDPKFVEVIKYIIDENRAKGLKYIIENSIGTIDKAVPLILKSNTFDEFMASAGIILDVRDSVKVGLGYPIMNGQMSFGVPAMSNPLEYDRAIFVIGNKLIHMNNASHSYYDWSFAAFKKRFDIDFETRREAVAKNKDIVKATFDIYNKLIPILNSWEDCTLLIEESPDIKLRERQAKFQTLVNDFWAEFEQRKLLIPQDLADSFQEITDKTTEYVTRNGGAIRFVGSKPMNPELSDAHYVPIDALKIEIIQLRQIFEIKLRNLASGDQIAHI